MKKTVFIITLVILIGVGLYFFRGPIFGAENRTRSENDGHIDTQDVSAVAVNDFDPYKLSSTFGNRGGWRTSDRETERELTVISKVTKELPRSVEEYGGNDATIEFTNEFYVRLPVTISPDEYDFDDSGDSQKIVAIFRESLDDRGHLEQTFYLLPDQRDGKVRVIARYNRGFCCDGAVENEYRLLVADLENMTTNVYDMSSALTLLE